MEVFNDKQTFEIKIKLPNAKYIFEYTLSVTSNCQVNFMNFTTNSVQDN